MCVYLPEKEQISVLDTLFYPKKLIKPNFILAPLFSADDMFFNIN